MVTGDARRSTLRGPDGAWTRSRVIVAAIVVCVAYFLGAQLGLHLRLPGATPSVLWPPNALLTSALLLVPPRHWGAMLLAAFPAHLTLSMGTDWPAAMIGLLFLTNCSEALIGATLLRRISDTPNRFDSLQRLFAFVVSVALVAPIVSSFLDAAVVSSFSTESYWDVWRARTFANVLTAVTVVPAVTSVAGYLTSSQPWPPVRRMLEWTALGAGLLATWFAIPFAEARYTFIPGAVRVPLAFLLPFIAWAAVRFGTIGASVTVLMTTLLAIVSAAHGNSPFFTLSPGETLIGVQFVILAAALPHLALAAAIDERRQALDAVAARLDFERLLGQLAHAFLDAPTEPAGNAYPNALREVGERLHFDAVLLLRREGQALVVTSSWFRHDVIPAQRQSRRPASPGAESEILANREVLIGGVDDYPVDAHEDRRSFTTLGYKSGFALPLASAKEVLGCIGYVCTGTPMRWDRDLSARLRLIAEIFGSAMARQHAEDALVGNEMLKTAILSSLASGVAVLDRHGCVIAMNERWAGLARDSGLEWADVSIGEDLLARARTAETREAERVVEGALGVLSGGLLRCVVPHQIASLARTAFLGGVDSSARPARGRRGDDLHRDHRAQAGRARCPGGALRAGAHGESRDARRAGVLVRASAEPAADRDRRQRPGRAAADGLGRPRRRGPVRARGHRRRRPPGGDGHPAAARDAAEGRPAARADRRRDPRPGCRGARRERRADPRSEPQAVAAAEPA